MSALQLYIHLAWTTRDRRAMIDAATKPHLEDFLRKSAAREGVQIVALGIVQTHVHMLIRSGPRVDLARLLQMLKGGSSHAMNRLPGNVLGLRWAREYSATTVSPKNLRSAIAYVIHQEGRHPDERIRKPS